jgi:hypothetical protein
MKNGKAVLNKLREAESLIGTETTKMFMDIINPEHRLGWLRETRALLKQNSIEPENLSGEWHTNE